MCSNVSGIHSADPHLRQPSSDTRQYCKETAEVKVCKQIPTTDYLYWFTKYWLLNWCCNPPGSHWRDKCEELVHSIRRARKSWPIMIHDSTNFWFAYFPGPISWHNFIDNIFILDICCKTCGRSISVKLDFWRFGNNLWYMLCICSPKENRTYIYYW